jgi:putative hydrolase of HD superfamily
VKSKGDAPYTVLEDAFLPSVSVYYQFCQLKQLFRQGWLQAGVPEGRCETVAEHSLGVVFLTALLGMDAFRDEDFNLLKALLMALIHDFGEIYAGDFTPSDQISPASKHELEADAVRRVFKDQPNGEYFLSLWEEYETGESFEATFVRQLDRLEMGLQASVFQRLGLLSEPDSFIQSMQEAVHQQNLTEIARQVSEITRKA